MATGMNDGSEGLGLALFAIYALSWEIIRRSLRSMHYEEAYWAERRGRARVEKEMRKISDVQLNKTDGFYVQPVAYIESCFRQCVGTPRQGALVPSSRARLILTNNVSPEALDGLQEFSHVWLSFKFHLNTNTLKEAKAFAGVAGDKRKFTFTAKITPPMLKEKKGVFATRSPHRPNPIGVTLAKIVSVCKASHSVLLAACDLVDGTPILDIKVDVQSASDDIFVYLLPVLSSPMFRLMTALLHALFQLG
jgi:tRNA (adenine37-N6)-methyltransferase